MKKIKFVFLILCLLFLSGCVSKYELEINGNKFNESITTFIYDGDREKDLHDEGEFGGRIAALVDENVSNYPFFHNFDYAYKKKVEVIENYEKVNLKYQYSDIEFQESNAVKLCFQNYNFDIGEDNYNFDLNGYFYCLYNNDSLEIVVKTNNKVNNSNAHEIKGNKYIWRIDQNNFENVDIKINVSKENEMLKTFSIISFIVIITIITFVIFYIVKRRKKMNEI